MDFDPKDIPAHGAPDADFVLPDAEARADAVRWAGGIIADHIHHPAETVIRAAKVLKVNSREHYQTAVWLLQVTRVPAPAPNRPFGAPICDAAHYQAEKARTAAIVAAGDPDAEIAMIGRPPVTLGALQRSVEDLTGGASSREKCEAAANLLIASTHGPFRVLGAKYLEGSL